MIPLRLSRFFSLLLPRSYRDHVRIMLRQAGFSQRVERWLGNVNLLSLLLLVIAILIPLTLQSYIRSLAAKIILFLIGGFILFFIIHLVYYFRLYFNVENRRQTVEFILPDFLQLISSNLRSGMTPYAALRAAARPEFGLLAEEVRRATAQSLGTESFPAALAEISGRIRSDMVDRSIALFTTALQSGASLAQVLDEIAFDLSENKSLKRELVNSTKTYTAFILFTIIFGSPLLFAISMHFITVVGNLQGESSLSGSTTAGVTLFAGDIVITTEFLAGVSIAMLIITSLLASVLMGVVKEGREKYGLRYAPGLIAVCLIMFFLFRIIITRMFG